MRIGILGGGLTGLTLASGLNTEFEVLEKMKNAVGYAGAFRRMGLPSIMAQPI